MVNRANTVFVLSGLNVYCLSEDGYFTVLLFTIFFMQYLI